MRVLAEQDCPVCGQPIVLTTPTKRWTHPNGPCASPNYERLCDPNGPNGGVTTTTARERAQLRADTLRHLSRTRTRGRPNRAIQRLVDNDSALAQPSTNPGSRPSR